MGNFGPNHALNSDGPPPESVEQPSTERSARGVRQPQPIRTDGFQQAGPPPWLFGAERLGTSANCRFTFDLASVGIFAHATG